MKLYKFIIANIIHKCRGDKWIDKYIRKEIRDCFSVPIRVSHGERFIYFCQDEIEVINYTTLDNTPREKVIFSNYIQNMYGIDMKKYYFTYSLLHEIGHYFTIEDVDIEYENMIREILRNSTSANTDIAYFNLPSEQLANDYASIFFEQYPEIVDYFQNEVVPLIRWFYHNKPIENYINVRTV
jgi:hypothetical protein